MKQTISMRQAGVMMLFCILANKMLLLPSSMFAQMRADAVIGLVILFVLDIASLPIFITLKKRFPDKKLVEILSEYLTKYVAKAIFVILLVFMLFKALLTFSVVYDYFKSQIYQEEFIWIALICIFPVMNHAVMKGLRPTARTMELLFTFVLLGIFICFFISFFTNLSLPSFFVTPAKDILSGSYRYIFLFGDFSLLFLVIDKIEYKKEEEGKLYKFTLFAMAIVVILFVIFFAKYNITAFMHNNALADILVFSVQFNAIGRLDIIAMMTIMTFATFQMEIFCLAFCESFEGIFPLLDKKWAIFIFDLSFFLLYYLYVGKYEVIISTTTQFLPILGAIVAYLLPLLFLLIALKRRKNE